jgi:hypothetical protein
MFNTGDRVRLSNNVLHAEFRGMMGTVKRVIKTRNMVWVECDNGKRYDAFPTNVELIAERRRENDDKNRKRHLQAQGKMDIYR